MKKTKASLGGALTTILIFTAIGVLGMAFAGFFTGEWLYFVAGGLFAISGVSGVFVVRALRATIEKNK